MGAGAYPSMHWVKGRWQTGTAKAIKFVVVRDKSLNTGRQFKQATVQNTIQSSKTKVVGKVQSHAKGIRKIEVGGKQTELGQAGWRVRSGPITIWRRNRDTRTLRRANKDKKHDESVWEHGI